MPALAWLRTCWKQFPDRCNRRQQGNIIGTTSDGGTYNSGVAFEITP
jgi:hypothetical protein